MNRLKETSRENIVCLLKPEAEYIANYYIVGKSKGLMTYRDIEIFPANYFESHLLE